MTVPSAKIIADSITPEGDRLTTMEIVCHRFVLAEFNTHRAFSRNSASSRAIPVKKQLERVRNDVAEPLEWPNEQKGMQGGDSIEDVLQAETWWLAASENAACTAEALSNLGVHKSVTNRLLEPFMWHTIIVSATEWDNFFEQRCSPLAQPEIRAVAERMREAKADSAPNLLREGEWHLPYFDSEDWEALRNSGLVELGRSMYPLAVRISAARCARVSYLTHDGKRDIRTDLELYVRLVTADPPHWSPLEHVATPWPENRQSEHALRYYNGPDGRVHHVDISHLPKVGNLRGWRSLRTEKQSA